MIQNYHVSFLSWLSIYLSGWEACFLRITYIWEVLQLSHMHFKYSLLSSSHNSTRDTCGKQYRAPLNLTLENQVSLTIPYLQTTSSILTLTIRILTNFLYLKYSSVMYNRKIYGCFTFCKNWPNHYVKQDFNIYANYVK